VAGGRWAAEAADRHGAPGKEGLMTGVDRIGGSLPLARASGRLSSAGEAFTLREVAAEGPAAVAGPAEVLLGSMLALQELESRALRDREARRRGQDLLEALARLQRALLAGQDDRAVLRRLAELSEDIPSAADDGLRAAVAAAVVRARVELARHQRFTTG
jgi:hypothetical protein